MDLIPISFLDDLKILPKGEPVAVFMRHAKRFEIKDDELGLDVLLTEDGKKSAYDLGQGYLKEILVDAYSSPVQRCIDTAKNIIDGARKDIEVKTDMVLSGMEIFIDDLMDFSSFYFKYGMFKIFDLVYERKKVSGLNPIEEITKNFIKHIDSKLSKNGLSLFLSHDSFIAFIAIEVFRIKITDDTWPSFMEGIFMWKENDNMKLLFRGQIKSIKIE